MEPLTILFLIGLIILLGMAGEVVFKITGIPDVLPLLLFGLLIGFFAVDKTQITALAPVVSPLALMILLFDSGLRTKISEILRGTPRASLLAIFGIITSIIISAVAMSLFMGWSLLEGAILGAIVGGSSSAIIIGVVRNWKAKGRGELANLMTLESVVTDILCIIIAISLIQTFIYGNDDILAPGKLIVSAFSIGLVIGLFAGIGWLKTLSMFKGIPYEHMVTLAMVFIIYVIAESFGGSGAIAALFFGLILGNSNETGKIFRLKDVELEGADLRRFQTEISFFVRTFFFVFLGLMVSINSIWPVIVGIALTALLLLGRYVAVNIALFGSEMMKDKGLIASIAPRGLAAAVLSQLPLAFNMKNAALYLDLTFVVLITTIAVTTVQVFLAQKKGKEHPLMPIKRTIQMLKKKE